MYNWNNYDYMEQVDLVDIEQDFIETQGRPPVNMYEIEGYIDDLLSDGWMIEGDDGNYYREQ